MIIRIFKIRNIPIIKVFVRISQRGNSPSRLFIQLTLVQMIDSSLVPTHLILGLIQDILKQHTTSENIKLYCVQYMRDETHSFEYTCSVLRELDLGARKEIERLGGNKGLIAILDRLKVESGSK